MKVLCLDLEGVLVPEVWQGVATLTGIDALQRTTRDIPVYDDLMQYRLRTLAEHDVRYSTVRDVIDAMEPLPGAVEFLDWARTRFQVAILSDTFYEFGMPLMAKLGYPLLLCHRLQVEDDRIVGYTLRQEDPKRRSVQAFHSLDLQTVAAGDSFNDVSMLNEAGHGMFFDAPENVIAEHPHIPSVAGYVALKAALDPLA